MTTEHNPGAISVTVPVNPNQILGVLVNAFDHGIGYWAEIVGKTAPPANADCSWIDPSWSSEKPTSRYLAPLLGGAVIICVREFDGDEDDRTRYTLDAAALQRGLNKMATSYPRHFADLVSEHDDATTADVLVQLALFDDLIFG